MFSVKTTDKLRSVFVLTSIIGRTTDVSNWLPPVHNISEATMDRVIGGKQNNHYNLKSEFETRTDKMADQDFGRQNDPMSQPTFDLTPIGMNMTNRTTSPIQ